MTRFLRFKYALLLSVFLASSSASAAGLLISIDDLNQSGGKGSFELLLTNTDVPGGTTYDIAGFSFELNAAASGLIFTAADYPSGTPAYIFDGTGQTTQDPTIPLSTNAFPTSDVSGSDTEFTSSSIAVAPGDVFSLALISFTSPTPVTVSGLESLISTSGTVLSDANLKAIAYSLPSTAVPEPSSVAMVALAGTLILSLRGGAVRPRSAGS